MIKKDETNKKKQTSALGWRRSKTGTIAVCGVLTALAMIFSYIESLIPIPLPIPGIRLGVANIAVLTVLYIVGWREALIINVIRISLTAVLFGNLNSFLFSMAGGMLSMLAMIILKHLKFSMTGVSVAGGVAHNIGQIVAAIYIMGSSAIIYYLPVLIITGVFTGIIIGILGVLITERVRLGITPIP